MKSTLALKLIYAYTFALKTSTGSSDTFEYSVEDDKCYVSDGGERSVVVPQSDCCTVDSAREEEFKKFCVDFEDEELYATHVFYTDEDECHRVSTRRTVYFTASDKETNVGEPDYYVWDTPTAMIDCCLNIDDWPETNGEACEDPDMPEFDTFSWDGETCTKTTTTITERKVAKIPGEEIIILPGTERTNIMEVSQNDCCLDEFEAMEFAEITACSTTSSFK